MLKLTSPVLTIIILLAILMAAIPALAAPGNPLDGLAKLKDAQSMRASSSDPNWQNGNADARPIEPGKTLVLGELEGPGIINHIWNTIASSERGYPRLLVLRMYWDGEDKPSVESPIGDFFGIGHGLDVPYSSTPVTITSDGRGRNCYWPMPFGKSAKITVTNEGKKRCDAFYYYIDWQKLPKLDDGTAYLHAMYRQEFPTVMGRNYMIADIVGRGHYVGTVLSVRQHLASWWGEGDDFFFIDGATEPQLRGTGSEDYFCDGWGFRKMSTPYYGAPLMEGNEPFQKTTVYRWHIPDPVVFAKSLRMEIEHKGVTFKPDGSVKSGFEEREDDFSSVAFWYQTEPHKPYPDMPQGYARLYFNYQEPIEAESLIPNAKASTGKVEEQQGNYSGKKQLFWTPAQANQTLTIPFEVKESGKKMLDLAFTNSFDYGKFLLELDGKKLGPPIDLYNASVTTREVTLGPLELTPGQHTLVIKNGEKNPESKGYYLGLDAIYLGN